jgi:hypothetical protein
MTKISKNLIQGCLTIVGKKFFTHAQVKMILDLNTEIHEWSRKEKQYFKPFCAPQGKGNRQLYVFQDLMHLEILRILRLAGVAPGWLKYICNALDKTKKSRISVLNIFDENLDKDYKYHWFVKCSIDVNNKISISVFQNIQDNRRETAALMLIIDLNEIHKNISKKIKQLAL